MPSKLNRKQKKEILKTQAEDPDAWVEETRLCFRSYLENKVSMAQMWSEYEQRLKNDERLVSIQEILQAPQLSPENLVQVEELFSKVGDVEVLRELDDELLVRYFQQKRDPLDSTLDSYIFPIEPSSGEVYRYLNYHLNSSYADRQNNFMHLFVRLGESKKNTDNSNLKDQITDDELNLMIHHLFTHQKCLVDLIVYARSSNVFEGPLSENNIQPLFDLAEKRHGKESLTAQYLRYLLSNKRLGYAAYFINLCFNKSIDQKISALNDYGVIVLNDKQKTRMLKYILKQMEEDQAYLNSLNSIEQF